MAVDISARHMSLRDHFAAVALSTVVVSLTTHGNDDKLAKRCYELADAMMKEREKWLRK